MKRDDVVARAHAFVVALSRKDAAALSALFEPAQPRYADPSRLGLSQGQLAVREHLQQLCNALGESTVTPLDVLADQESACVRWMAQLPQQGHALDAVTWMRIGARGIDEARSFFDASLFLSVDDVRPDGADKEAPHG